MSVDFESLDTAEEIRQKMQRTRRHLQPEVHRIVEDAQKLMDWQHYLKRAPFLFLGGVAAVAYLAVPKRLNVMSPDAETLEKLSKKQKLVVEPKPSLRAKSGPISSLANLVAMTAIRAGIGYLGQFAAQQFEQTQDKSGRKTQNDTREQSYHAN